MPDRVSDDADRESGMVTMLWLDMEASIRGGPGAGARRHMTDWVACAAVESDPDRLSGAWVFRGTRVPVVALFENLKDGVSTDQFLEWFPGVDRWKVESVLDHEVRALAGSDRL